MPSLDIKEIRNLGNLKIL